MFISRRQNMVVNPGMEASGCPPLATSSALYSLRTCLLSCGAMPNMNLACSSSSTMLTRAGTRREGEPTILGSPYTFWITLMAANTISIVGGGEVSQNLGSMMS